MNARTLKFPRATKLLLLLLLLLALPVAGQNNFTYAINSDGTITLTGYSGFAQNLMIPSTYAGAAVTGIGAGAFFNSGVGTAVVPASVTNIGVNAFLGLGSITVDPANPNYRSLNGILFDKTQTTLLEFLPTAKGGGYTIPASVTGIGDYAFYNCYNLTNVTIPYGINSIGYGAFWDCGLTSITIPNGVTNIGSAAFVGCSGLTNIAIPASITSIGGQVFQSCIKLTSVTIPGSVTNIGNSAFYGCASLTNVTIGNGVTNIASFAFQNCYNLKGVYFQGNAPTPTNDLTVFSGDTNATGYVLLGTKGWGTNFDGLPIMTNYTGSIVGNVPDLAGNVTVTHQDGTTNTLQQGDSINFGDIVTTAAGGRAEIRFQDNTTITFPENCRLKINSYVYNPNDSTGSASYSWLHGVFVYVGGLMEKNNSGNVNIETVADSIGIRGTQFIARQDPCSSAQTVYLIEGELAITPTGAPSVTNICDAPVTISITATNVTTTPLDQTTYNSISNQVFQNTGIVTFTSWQEQYFGCTDNPNAAPNADPDGDGVGNYAEFLAGTNPTNNASFFHFLSARTEGNNLRVTWLCGGGRTNVLQATTNYGASWFNISPNIVLPGGGDSVTNYLDVGAVTNIPRRMYRMYLVP